jgi:hypothetical protein
MQRSDTETVRLAKLATDHGLPADASPRAISDAMKAKQDAWWSDFYSGGNNPRTAARFLALAREYGCDPETASRDQVWEAMRQKGTV